MKPGEEQGSQRSSKADGHISGLVPQATVSAPRLASSARSAARPPPPAPPTPGRSRARSEPPRRIRTRLELAQWVLDDWSRTLRLIVLMGGLALSVAGIVLVIQLNADQWTRVLFHGSVILLGGSATLIGVLHRCELITRREAAPPDEGREPSQDGTGPADGGE